METNIKERLSKYYTSEEIDKIAKGYHEERYVTLRINTIKSTKEEVIKILNDNHITYEEVSWFNNALVITNVKEDIIKELDIFKNGHIYLQSLSSMIPPLILDANKDDQVLDMCAAPGGKTTEIAALANNEVMITAIEKNKIRADRLKYNLDLQGVKKCTVLNIDSKDLNEYMSFDKILLDTPCSGSGTLTTNKEYIDEKLLSNLIPTQEKLLRKALSILKKNGTLVYSTCSIFKEENEYIINKIKKDFNIEIIPINMNNLPLLTSEIEGSITLYPTKYYEGFYVIKIKKL